MAAEDGMEDTPVGLGQVEAALREDATSFEFFQAVRLLEALRPKRSAVGHFVDPAEEVVRFSVPSSLAFPPSEIQSLELPEKGQARMRVNFMGLTGPLGVLPHTYSLLVTERERARDRALGAFLDLFHHRLISLFYRAWRKHRSTAAGDRDIDRLKEHLRDLAGIGLESMQDRLPLSDEALISYIGLIAPQPRSAAALQQLLADYFEVPVEIEQFIGGWYSLSVKEQCPVGEENGATNRLGLGAVVGDEVWDPQSRVRIRIGPLTRTQFDRFLPTGSAYEPLRALARFFSHDQQEFEVQLILARDEVPGCVLDTAETFPQPLGWSTWIRSTAFSRDADETILKL
jgi:type VI secretion system protein ImpH